MDEVDSAPLDVVVLKSTIGASSSSVMVYVWASSEPRLALLGLDNVTITVSFASSNASSIILAMVIVPDVLPAGIVSVPFANV